MHDQPLTGLALEQFAAEALADLAAAADSQALESWYVAYLGRKGRVTLMVRRVGELPKEERPAFGQRANQVKQELEAAYEKRAEAIKAAEMEQALATGAVDVTLPGRPVPRGRLHPSTQTLRRIYQIWADMGFQVYRSRDVETDEYNFQLLNFPPHHPARDMQDTFYTTSRTCCCARTPRPARFTPCASIARSRSASSCPACATATSRSPRASEIQFHQVEGLAVGHNIRFTDLKGTLTDFARRMFGAGRKTRFRASYFPFTEPSAEMDVECILCDGQGCRAVQVHRLAGDSGLRHGAPGGAAQRRLRSRPSTAASPLAWGRSASPCCTTASRTSAISGATTCAFWSSSEEQDDNESTHLAGSKTT